MISVVGSGKIGSNVAVHLALSGLDDITLVDVVQGLPQGEAEDIRHMISAYGLSIDVRGTNRFEDISGSDIVVVSAGFGRKPGQTRLDLMQSNAGIIRDVSSKIKQNCPECVLVMVTNPLDVMTYIAQKTTGFERSRVVGMSGTLDGARLRYALSKQAGVSPSSITPMVIGEHGENMVPVYGSTSIGGVSAVSMLSKDKLDQATKYTRETAADIISKKGATIHGPAAAATVLVSAIKKDTHSLITASTLLDGEYGYRDVVMNVPLIVGRRGVEKIVEINLSQVEKSMMDTAYNTIREAISKLNLS
ncbi:MAG: malate dehydrogenase [Thermoprotei archaeon]